MRNQPYPSLKLMFVLTFFASTHAVMSCRSVTVLRMRVRQKKRIVARHTRYSLCCSGAKIFTSLAHVPANCESRQQTALRRSRDS